MTTISIARNFSRFPAGRFVTDGKYSGQACRENLIAPSLRSHEKVIVDLNGTLGYGSSFLEEAFGGLVREEGFFASDLHKRITFVADDPSLIEEIWSYIEDADRAPIAAHA